jgi:hypothetical protein
MCKYIEKYNYVFFKTFFAKLPTNSYQAFAFIHYSCYNYVQELFYSLYKKAAVFQAVFCIFRAIAVVFRVYSSSRFYTPKGNEHSG